MRKITLVLAVVFFSVSILTAQSIRIGYVDSQIILQQLPEAQKAQKELDELLQKWQAELDKLTKEYQQKLDEYQKKEAFMNEEAKAKAQKELADLEQKIIQFRNEKLGPQGELEREREKRFKPIRDKIYAAIEAVAKEEKLNFVFDKAGDFVLLYADKRFDITYKVLDKLTRGVKSK